eukprot:TRINITY_DN5565_c0_g1_i2.p1 TRINITY_DN5565_c0_g1~~TRINITY_DN5565_c0_g1_i2.p1  ORF type:complete len:514 (-),score=114.91 TRINITY_DN5565_c0_g1_i2:347-1888(-)
MKETEKSKAMVPDPSIPRWLCQSCKQPLCIVGAESYAEKFGGEPLRSVAQGSSMHVAGSVLGASRMDHSFVVLPKQRNHASGIPPRPRAGGLHGTHGGVNSAPDTHGGKAIEESFVVLPPSAASMYRCETSPEIGGLEQQKSPGSTMTALHTNNTNFHSCITVLKRAFDTVASQTQVEQPLCLECMRILSEKLEEELEDVNQDIRAYESALENLEGEQPSGLNEADFLLEKARVEEEQRKLEAAIEETDRQLEDIRTQQQELEIKSKELDEMEERFWHEFNDFKFQLTNYKEERDALITKSEVTQTQLEKLKQTNVLNDAFHIWHDGEFGTINNFRLGRLPSLPVDWDEINAAWGQACLLLHQMAMQAGVKFSYRIIPMGSYPSIADGKNKYELFGPVNLFWSTRYDKAMTCFLTCLKEFAEFATAKDAGNKALDKCFKLPYKIDNDKVEGYSITQSFNKPDNWTKALKYMLCDLKWALYWFIDNYGFQSPSTIMKVSLLSSSPARVENSQKK